VPETGTQYSHHLLYSPSYTGRPIHLYYLMVEPTPVRRFVMTVVSTKQPLSSVLLAQPPSLLPQLAKPRLAVGYPGHIVSFGVVLDDLQGTVLCDTTFLQHRCDQ